MTTAYLSNVLWFTILKIFHQYSEWSSALYMTVQNSELIQGISYVLVKEKWNVKMQWTWENHERKEYTEDTGKDILWIRSHWGPMKVRPQEQMFASLVLQWLKKCGCEREKLPIHSFHPCEATSASVTMRRLVYYTVMGPCKWVQLSLHLIRGR